MVGGRLELTTWQGRPPTVVALHGFSLHGRSFARCAGGFRLVAPTLPGHGRSRVYPLTMDGTVSALAALLADAGPVDTVVGYSMGGRVALHLALTHPDAMARLVVVSAGLGLTDGAERESRLRKDQLLARRIERVGTAAFLGEWLGQPLTGTAHLPDDVRTQDYELRCANEADGLAAALRGLGPGAHPPLHDRIIELRMPTTWIAGTRDPTYATIARTAAALTGGSLRLIEGGGHNLVLERPDEIRKAILESS